MSILDKARNAINARKQAEDEKATAEQRARDWRSNEAQRRAERFHEKLGLPASLKATVEDGTITIRHKRQVVVEITFDWTTPAANTRTVITRVSRTRLKPAGSGITPSGCPMAHGTPSVITPNETHSIPTGTRAKTSWVNTYFAC
jgi:hypothetical protein